MVQEITRYVYVCETEKGRERQRDRLGSFLFFTMRKDDILSMDLPEYVWEFP